MQSRKKDRKHIRRRFIIRSLLTIGVISLFTAVFWLMKPFVGYPQAIGQTDTSGQAFASFDIGNLSKPIPKEYNGQLRKVVYLTFDDGPSKYTAAILDLLKEHDIKATFFMLGPNMIKHEAEVKRMVDEQHYPGLHSMSHNYTKLYRSGGSSNFIHEFTEAQEIVRCITSVKPTLIRAPYGSAPQIGDSFRGDIANAGFHMWDWSIDSNDWKYAKQPEAIINRVKSSVKRNVEVILFHEKQQTIDALPEIIRFLKDSGYEFQAYQPESHMMMNFHQDTRL